MSSAAAKDAIRAIRDRKLPPPSPEPGPRATEVFGSLVFGDAVQKARLPKEVYRALRRTITQGEP
ncbi:MAG: hypothetical protein KJ061_01765, partial [Vicinamibacteraceae bacterium]|nr:hypothetical protein [Vicinamibacteraceae bacterium]